jgi:hypothetical protein
MRMAFVVEILDMNPDDRAAYMPGFRVPPDAIADFESLCHPQPPSSANSTGHYRTHFNGLSSSCEAMPSGLDFYDVDRNQSHLHGRTRDAQHRRIRRAPESRFNRDGRGHS